MAKGIRNANQQFCLLNDFVKIILDEATACDVQAFPHLEVVIICTADNNLRLRMYFVSFDTQKKEFVMRKNQTDYIPSEPIDSDTEQLIKDIIISTTNCVKYMF